MVWLVIIGGVAVVLLLGFAQDRIEHPALWIVLFALGAAGSAILLEVPDVCQQIKTCW